MSIDLYIVIQHPTGVCEVWMFGVDVGQLYCHQVMHLRRENRKTSVINRITILIKHCGQNDNNEFK